MESRPFESLWTRTASELLTGRGRHLILELGKSRRHGVHATASLGRGALLLALHVFLVILDAAFGFRMLGAEEIRFLSVSIAKTLILTSLPTWNWRFGLPTPPTTEKGLSLIHI